MLTPLAVHDEVRRLLTELNAYLPLYRERLGDQTYTLVRSNLRVLTECFYNNPLTLEAAELIYDHLTTLAHMLAFRAN